MILALILGCVPEVAPPGAPCAKSAWYADPDGDGFGSGEAVMACEAPEGHVASSDDCGGDAPDRYPGAPELCDDTDNDCDAAVDEDEPTWYLDVDHDGVGGEEEFRSCDPPTGYVATAGDCDDADPTVYPSATELCDEKDNDCDEAVDDDAQEVTWYPDGDGDNYGVSTGVVESCEPLKGYALQGGDCDDTRGEVYPGAAEVCDELDDDCDGDVDDADSGVVGQGTWYVDDDGDGFGTTSMEACFQPEGTAAADDDCDDTRADVNPAGLERCDGDDTDEDCDGDADDADPSALDKATVYPDSDGDGYGVTASAAQYCDPPTGYVDAKGDCDDGASGVNPAASEVCDAANTDEDCDGKSDDDDASATGQSTWYHDADSDGYGSTTTKSRCDQPSAHVSVSGDCNDAKSAINPGASEVCDSADTDEDCDGAADDDDKSTSGKSTLYQDADGDGYGDPSTSQDTCESPSGWVSDDSDCDDAHAEANPKGTEVCDSLDNDCDGSADWGLGVPGSWSSISSAVAAASSGSTICVAAGTYSDNVDLGSKELVIEGFDGSASTVLVGASSASPTLKVAGGQSSSTRVEGITLTPSGYAYGGGLYVYGADPELVDLVVDGGTCSSGCAGSAAYFYGSQSILDGVSIMDHSLSGSYGAVYVGGSSDLILLDVQISGITGADGTSGVALYIGDNSSVSAQGFAIVDNAGTGGAASSSCFGTVLVGSGSSADLSQGWISDNTLSGCDYAAGGGLYTGGGTVSLTNVIISGNEVSAAYTGYGGGVCAGSAKTGSLSLVNVDVVGNYAEGGYYAYGGGLYADGTVSVLNTSFWSNSDKGGSAASGSAYYGTLSSLSYSAFSGSSLDLTACNGSACSTTLGTGVLVPSSPGYTDTSAAATADWDLTLTSSSSLKNKGNPASTYYDTDGSRNDIGSYGGPGGGW